MGFAVAVGGLIGLLPLFSSIFRGLGRFRGSARLRRLDNYFVGFGCREAHLGAPCLSNEILPQLLVFPLSKVVLFRAIESRWTLPVDVAAGLCEATAATAASIASIACLRSDQKRDAVRRPMSSDRF